LTLLRVWSTTALMTRSSASATLATIDDGDEEGVAGRAQPLCTAELAERAVEAALYGGDFDDMLMSLRNQLRRCDESSPSSVSGHNVKLKPSKGRACAIVLETPPEFLTEMVGMLLMGKVQPM